MVFQYAVIYKLIFLYSNFYKSLSFSKRKQCRNSGTISTATLNNKVDQKHVNTFRTISKYLFSSGILYRPKH